MDPNIVIGPNPRMRAIFEYVALIGPGVGSVLITGESGTGKEVVANAREPMRLGVGEDRVRPQLGQATLGRRARHGQREPVTAHATTGVHDGAARDDDRHLFTGDKGVVDRAVSVEQDRVGRHDFLRTQRHRVAGSQCFDTRQHPLVAARDPYREREKRLHGAIERDAFERLLLEELADQQEEDQAGERVEKAFAATDEDLDHTAAEEHGEPQGNRHVECDRARARGRPRRTEVVSGAEEQHRQGEGQIEQAEQFPELRGQRRAVGVARDAEEHHVAEREAGDADLQIEAATNRGDASGLRRVEHRFIAQRRELFGDLAQGNLGGSEFNGDGALHQIGF